MSDENLIVVGVDGSAPSRRAVAWAVEEAQLRSLVVLAVSAWDGSRPGADAPLGTSARALADVTVADTRAMLSHIVDAATVDYPAVHIRQRVVHALPSAELVALSDHAALLVVGSKGHGAVTGLLLGSVSQHILAHGRCTVVVVR